jgi:HTH-type transcriptional regulator/antitoxin HigA
VLHVDAGGTALAASVGAPKNSKEKRPVQAGEQVLTKAKRRAAKLPDTYFEWVRRHPLKSIQSEADLHAAQAIMDELLRQDLDGGGLAYLDALSDLVGVYEREHHPIPPLPPHQLLAHLLEERDLSQADLVRRTGIAKATVSDLANGKRAFTVDQMHRVARVFGVPAMVFLPTAV